MAAKKYVDLEGLKTYHGKIKSYIDGSDSALNTAIGTKQDTLTPGDGISISSNTISVSYTSQAEGTNAEATTLSLVTTGEKYKWNHKQNALTWDNSPTYNSTNAISSGAVYSAINTVSEVANGRTATYVLNATGSVNSTFNSSNNTVTMSSGTITLIDNTSLALSSLKVGDILLITATDLPDRWLGSISSGTYTFYKMETTKVDLTPYVTKSTFGGKGDLLVGSGSGTYSAFSIGNNANRFLKANANADGLEWADVDLSSRIPYSLFTGANQLIYGTGSGTASVLAAATPTSTRAKYLTLSLDNSDTVLGWKDVPTTYGAGNGLQLSGSATDASRDFSVKIDSTGSCLSTSSSGLKFSVSDLIGSSTAPNGGAWVKQSSGKLYVTVSEINSNSAHAHTAGDGLSISGSGGTSGTTTYSVKAVANGGITVSSSGVSVTTGYTNDSNNVAVTADSTSGKLYATITTVSSTDFNSTAFPGFTD